MSKNAEDAAWARRSLSLVLVASGNPKSSLEALDVVGVKLDAAGNIVEEKAAETFEELLARAKVLALQQRKTLRTRSIALLESLQKKNMLAPEDQFLLAQLYINQGPDPVWWGKTRDILIGLVKSYPRQPQFLLFFAQQSLAQQGPGRCGAHDYQARKRGKGSRPAPGELGTVELRARIHEASGNAKGAARAARIRRCPGPHRSAGFAVASLQGRMGNLKEAIETGMAVTTTPEHQAKALTGILRRFHGSSHLAKNKAAWSEQVEVVEAFLRKKISDQPDKLILRLHLADLQDLLGRYDEVEKLCREVLERDPNNLPALNNLAWMLAQRKTHPDEALKLINRAIETHGPRPELLDTRAVVYITLGRSEPALADLNHATRDAPTAAKFFNLARADYLTRDTKSALQALNQASALGLDEQRMHPAEREVYRQVTAELKGR